MSKKQVDTKIYSGSVSAGSGFSLMILAYIVLALLVSAIIGLTDMEETNYWYTIIIAPISIVALGGMIGYYSFYRKENVLLTSGVKKFNPIYIAVALVFSAGMLLGLGIVNDLVAKGVVSLGGSVGNGGNFKMDNVWQFFGYLLVLAVLPAILEEAFFRGFMLNALSGMKMVGRVLTVALCFALFHGEISQFAYQFIYGAVLSIITLWAGSVIPAMIAHFANNFVILLLTYLGITQITYTWWLIVIGAVLLLAVGGALYLLHVKNQNQLDIKEKEYCLDLDARKQTARTAHKEFWWPYSIIGIIACVVLIVGNLLA